MSRVVLGKCPVCSNRLRVVKLHCDSCNTEISGDFELDRFSYLNKEQKYFVEIFIKKRGNIKEIEKELGISYPTVRRNLDQVIEAMGYFVEKEDVSTESEKERIIHRLAQGEINAQEAMDLLEELE